MLQVSQNTLRVPLKMPQEPRNPFYLQGKKLQTRVSKKSLFSIPLGGLCGYPQDTSRKNPSKRREPGVSHAWCVIFLISVCNLRHNRGAATYISSITSTLRFFFLYNPSWLYDIYLIINSWSCLR